MQKYIENNSYFSFWYKKILNSESSIVFQYKIFTMFLKVLSSNNNVNPKEKPPQLRSGFITLALHTVWLRLE